METLINQAPLTLTGFFVLASILLGIVSSFFHKTEKQKERLFKLDVNSSSGSLTIGEKIKSPLYESIFCLSWVVAGIFSKTILPVLLLYKNHQPTNFTFTDFLISLLISFIFGFLAYNNIKDQANGIIGRKKFDKLRIGSIYFSLGYGVEAIISDIAPFLG